MLKLQKFITFVHLCFVFSVVPFGGEFARLILPVLGSWVEKRDDSDPKRFFF